MAPKQVDHRGRRLGGSQEGGELAAGISALFNARALVVRVYPQVMVFKARRIVHTRAYEELLKEGKRSLGKRAVELKSVVGMRPEIRVTSEEVSAIVQKAAGECPEPTLVAIGRRAWAP